MDKEFGVWEHSTAMPAAEHRGNQDRPAQYTAIQITDPQDSRPWPLATVVLSHTEKLHDKMVRDCVHNRNSSCEIQPISTSWVLEKLPWVMNVPSQYGYEHRLSINLAQWKAAQWAVGNMMKPTSSSMQFILYAIYPPSILNILHPCRFRDV